MKKIFMLSRTPLLLFFLLTIVLFLWVDCVMAQPYRPLHALTVETEFQSTDYRSSGKKLQYHVSPEEQGSELFLVDFYHASQKSQLASRLRFMANGSLTWQKTMQDTPQTVSQPLFLRPGYPVPIDILPVGQQEEEKKYVVEASSGGRTFVKNYTMTVQEIELATAMENGWIRFPVGSEAILLLYTVTDVNGNSTSQQLWSAQENWWLFEKTPFRRSWRVQ